MPQPTPGDLPTSGQIDHLIRLLIEVLEGPSSGDLVETLQSFVGLNQQVLAELERISHQLAPVVKTIEPVEDLGQRLTGLERSVEGMSETLTKIHDAMMASEIG